MADYECFQSELSKGYGIAEWGDDVKKIMMEAGLESLPKALLFVDTQIQVCVEIHQSVAKKCQVYLAELARHNYLTPKSYLQFLSSFRSLIGKKKQELITAKNRMKDGLDKLLQAADDVAKMQEELESARPLLAQAAKDTVASMEQLQVDRDVAEETKHHVQAEEMRAQAKAQAAQAIADDAQKGLAKALPALDAALASLRKLNKNVTKEKQNKLEVAKLGNRDLLCSLENAITSGKPFLLENVGEELDPALEPVLLEQTYKQQGSTVLKLGDKVIPYQESFKMYITTCLPNPHYSPEISAKLTIIDFTLSPSGLEDQLLGEVVAAEEPDLEEARNQLMVGNTEMCQEIEDQILYRLRTSKGDPVGDLELIEVLGASKIKVGEIQAKVMVAEQTERDTNAICLQYVPVAVRSQILYFCVSDLSNVDPMYQYSLEWLLNIFLMGISKSERADILQDQIVSINNYIPPVSTARCAGASF